ncbi:efflux RND transporter periplasmic adaptor subunit [Acuticoccus sediminis]|uniref:efflux RND transporter periplasmic adaptor subunit n=1 Tax=Acuticoccus sediminis TaxID=2184697 RepID=UPI001CFE1328|nr:efflux RND transporter periplasmic adaptor subunit [Acuticoccus sediminis]
MTGLLLRLAVIGIAALGLAACTDETEREAGPGRIVRVETVTASDLGDVATITGDIQAEQEVARAFRIAGRLTDRPVNVGDAVKAGDLIARLDPQQEEAGLSAAIAAVVAAQGEVATAQNVYDRHAELLRRGFTTRARYDETLKVLRLAEAGLRDAEAQREVAEDRLAFTEIVADTDGVVTARGAEPGEVVAAGQMVVRIARDDGRDAVFDVPARLIHALAQADTLNVRLADDRNVTATGRVRVIAPEADPTTGTFEVRVGLDHPPASMLLGGSVVGEIELQSAVVVSIPASALTRGHGLPAVWTVEPETSTAALRPIEILSFAPGSVIVASGLNPSDVIVTAGTQALHPGQRLVPLPPNTN